MTTITNVLIASKVPSTFRDEVSYFCNQHDYTLSQAIRKGLLMFMKDVSKKEGTPSSRIADHIQQTEPQLAIQAVEQAAAAPAPAPETHSKPDWFGATAPI